MSRGNHNSHIPHRWGHNRGAAQWQTPHAQARQVPLAPSDEQDLDLVETAFADGFTNAADPTSFLRLAAIPFEARLADGTELRLLRVALDTTVDMGTLSPHMGGSSFRYDPLPAQLISRRKKLGFVYFDGAATRTLTFAEARALGQGGRLG